VLIVGTDILSSFHKWKNYQQILDEYQIYIYNRPGYQKSIYSNHPSIKFFEAPMMQLSSSFIRKAIQNGKDVRYMLPPKVWQYISEMHFYEK
jgi:nicotinate-nucleotide adenylyltransferase